MHLTTLRQLFPEDSISQLSKQDILQHVEFLNDFSFTKVSLNFIISCYFLFNNRVYQVLEQLPKQKKVIALGNQKFSIHRCFFWTLVKFLKCFLELKCYFLIKTQHFQHQLFDFLYSHYFKGFTEQLHHVIWRISKYCAIMVLVQLISDLRFLLEDSKDERHQLAVNFCGVSIA